MKLTKFFAASLAAVTLFSCTKEMAETPGEILNPGEARVEINLGQGVTTYATLEDETKINNSMYALYNTASKVLVPITKISTDVTKIQFTVLAADVLANPNVELVVVANTTGFTTIADGETPITMPLNLDEAKAMTIKGDLTNDAGELGTKGLPSSKTYVFTLNEGNVNVTNSPLKRAASRIYVKNKGSITDYTALAGFKIKYTGAKGTNLVSREVTTVGGTSTERTYSITGEAPADHASGLAIGYVYPTAVASFTVSFGGVDKIKTFETKANMNYGLNIIPKTTDNGEVSFDLTISEWETGTEHNIDMNGETPETPVINEATKSNRISIVNNVINIEGGSVKQTVDLATAFTGYTLVKVAVAGTRAVTALTAELDGTKLKLSAPENFTAENVTHSVVVTASKDSKEQEFTYTTVVTPSLYPENFIQRIAGLEVMLINAPKSASNTAEDNLSLATSIVINLNSQEGNTLLDKMVAFWEPSQENFRSLAGLPADNTKNAGYLRAERPICPTGFRSLTIADIELILGYTPGSFVTTYPTTNGSELSMMPAEVTDLPLKGQVAMKNNRKITRYSAKAANWNNDALAGQWMGSPSRYAEITSDGNDPFYYFQASNLVLDNVGASTRTLILKDDALRTVYTVSNSEIGRSAYRCVRE